jgi:hypothetical protein
MTLPNTIHKTRNVSGTEECTICIDGWCELAGTETFNGHEYSRGWAPCKWCELGLKRFMRATNPPIDKHDHHHRWEPASRFTRDDVIPNNEPHGHRQHPPSLPTTKELE